MFRPIKTLWVQLLTEQAEASHVMELLASAGVIELQRELPKQIPFDVAIDQEGRTKLQRLRVLRDSYAGILPQPNAALLSETAHHLETPQALEQVEQSLLRWSQDAAPLADEIRKMNAELANLELLETCLQALPDQGLDLAPWGTAMNNPEYRFSPWLALGPNSAQELLMQIPERHLLEAFPCSGAGDERIVILGQSERIAQPDIERRFHTVGARFVQLPTWIKGTPSSAIPQVRSRIEVLSKSKEKLQAQIEEINQEAGLAGALWLLDYHSWLVDALNQTGTGRHFLWITGWVPANRLQEITRLLEQSGRPFLLRTDQPVDDAPGPTVLHNPPWAKAFEMFVKWFGASPGNAVDPSPLLALMMPLMFGFMFGDVGQGAILMLVGWLLRGRFPVFGLFIPAGFSAMIFGLLFGSVFFNEHLLPPLWLHPISEPLLILLLPLAFGAMLILLSMTLAGVEAYWAGQGRAWWREKFPLILLYLGMPLALFSLQAGLLLMGAASLWRILAVALACYEDKGVGGVLAGAGKGLLELIECVMQMVTNTLSFARLGAFALVHAGLGLAVMTLAEPVANPLLPKTNKCI